MSCRPHALPIFGYNSRLDELQAAILNVKLRRLAKWNEARRKAADYYNEKLAGLDLALPFEAPGCEHVYHLYAIRTPRRDAIAARLQAAGIGFATHYKAPPHLQPAMSPFSLSQTDLPVTLRCADEVLQLPMYPELTTEQVDEVCKVVKAAL